MRDLETSPDIIKSAQQLLDGATPAPWEWGGYSLESEHGMVLDFQCVTAFGQSGALREVEVTPEDEVLIAAAPELAQALAEETWEYSFQKLHGHTWQVPRNPTTNLEEWWDNHKEAEWAAVEYMKRGHPCRIVRRRVSQPEVIEGI